MGTRKVRLDDEAEKALEQNVQATGHSVSSDLKQGLLTLQDHLAQQPLSTTYDIYAKLDLGRGAPQSPPQRRPGMGCKRVSAGIWDGDSGGYRPLSGFV